MLDELSLEGIGPSPEALKLWEEKRSGGSRTPSPEATEPLSLEAQLAAERAKSARLEEELKASQSETASWIVAASSLVNMLLLSPSQNASYASSVSTALENSLKNLSYVKQLRYCDCSFPACDAGKPRVVLRRWTSLEDSEWDLAWAPSWSCEACIDGQRGISFSTLLRVTNITLAGRLKISFAADFTTLSVRFVSTPAFHVNVSCHVTLGQMPLPIQAELGRLIRDEATDRAAKGCERLTF